MSGADKKVLLNDKVCIITGSNDGIGKETAKEMASYMMRVILACRNMEKCKIAAEEIKQASNNQNVHCMQLDLSSQKSIRTFVEDFKQLNVPLDYLINNAGIFGTPFAVTEDGYESQVATNHMGPFLLTNLLLPHMSPNGRIVVLASRSHERQIIPDFNKLNTIQKDYKPLVVYGQSKLCNVMYAYELQKRLIEKGSNIVVNSLHPGVVFTNLFNSFGGMPARAIFTLASPFLTKATESAKASTALALGVAPDLQGVKGQYFSVNKRIPSSPFSRDPANWAKLWTLSAEYCKIPEDIQLNKE
ncbi:short-chain dehydrogenase/reductase family protein [Cavenderia fasciculata]|uniref:Short-chain dehydrogenase/reductase family protein n=1 Tax=Cavenderia fasciculata TaxID=261658 RepID=F4PLY3_CACFS|nr:short-chain dehydrogenase/reductase family protein [Cavenderia fasciculata]EGG23537.1 short-chain dehydrogenase/reductase family protein [Cavenderia fasciculata]|eukprot:XP_004361388.1 short-chain dehydrogenase/reductase family protein [Cavenderia fasciculata]